jgi:hypothetical protein
MNGLFNSTVLDVAIGLVFVYLLLAIICSAINEWIASWFNLRAKNLKSAITQLLDGQPSTPGGKDADWFLNKFYTHPLIAGMHKQGAVGDAAHPSYLPSRAFATAVMDVATPGSKGSITFDDLEKGIRDDLPEGDVQKALLALIQNADRNLTTAQKNIETWFDDTMERMGGWYKRKIQIITIVIAVVLVFGANADTIRMTSILWRNPTQRAQMVEVAKGRAAKTDGASHETNNTELQDLDNLLGWGSKGKTAPQAEEYWKVWAWRLLGWFLTIVAVSLGAPFWFDLLNKVVNLRNAGEKPKTAQENSAEQTKATTTAAKAVAEPKQ